MKDNSWLGLYFGDFMIMDHTINSANDIIGFSANGPLSVIGDYNNSKPLLLGKENIDVSGSFTLENDEVKFTATRLLQTNEKNNDY